MTCGADAISVKNSLYYFQLCKFIHFIWAGPVLYVATTLIMWFQFGPSSLAAIGVMLVSMIAQSLLGKYFGYMRFHTRMLFFVQL